MLIVANLKANSFQFSGYRPADNDSVEVAMAAPFPLILKIEKPFVRAAQDVSAFEPGAYTGEVPARLLADLSVRYVLVGHSERRRYLGENTALVEKKIERAAEVGIVPIICAQNPDEIPANIRNFSVEKYLITYEPFSAISTEGNYHPENPERVVATIADWKRKLPAGVRLLYGGSINAENISGFLSADGAGTIFGFVIGHAALEGESLSAIINQCHGQNSH